MAITVAEAFGSLVPPVTILATDVDHGVLEQARAGIYPEERVHRLPAPILRRYFLQGCGANRGNYRVRPELRGMITFAPQNLLEPNWPKERFDAIFCRNVMIYFDRETQLAILRRLAKYLSPDGLLFVGHSENFHSACDLFKLCGHTVYRLR